MSRSYVESARAAFLAALGDTALDWDNDRPLLDLYTLLVFTRGEDCTCEDIHDAWAVARQRTRPDHADLIPFDRLAAEVQAYDVKFRDAVRAAAATLRVVAS